MEPHEQRVVDEKTELDGRLARLGEFVDRSPAFGALHPVDRALLATQRVHMENYSRVLGDRIARFPG